MCNHLLSRGKIAIVTKNTTCSCLNVTLPNINLHLDLIGFESFRAVIEQTYEIEKSKPEDGRCILIDTPFQGIVMYFRWDELSELRDTLNEAVLKIQLEDILGDVRPCQN